MTNNRKFYSIHSLNQFKGKLHPNRIEKEYDYIEQSTGKTVYVIKYYRDTKKLRRKHNFETTF